MGDRTAVKVSVKSRFREEKRQDECIADTSTWRDFPRHYYAPCMRLTTMASQVDMDSVKGLKKHHLNWDCQLGFVVMGNR